MFSVGQLTGPLSHPRRARSDGSMSPASVGSRGRVRVVRSIAGPGADGFTRARSVGVVRAVAWWWWRARLRVYGAVALVADVLLRRDEDG